MDTKWEEKGNKKRKKKHNFSISRSDDSNKDRSEYMKEQEGQEDDVDLFRR